MKLIKMFETNKCIVTVYETGQIILGQKLYIIRSKRKNDGHVNIRFGNLLQTECIIKTYRIVREIV